MTVVECSTDDTARYVLAMVILAMLALMLTARELNLWGVADRSREKFKRRGYQTVVPDWWIYRIARIVGIVLIVLVIAVAIVRLVRGTCG